MGLPPFAQLSESQAEIFLSKKNCGTKFLDFFYQNIERVIVRFQPMAVYTLGKAVVENRNYLSSNAVRIHGLC